MPLISSHLPLGVEGLSRFLDNAKCLRGLQGLQISQALYITHLLFVDDILIFYDGSKGDVEKLCQGLALFKRTSRTWINEKKTMISCLNLGE
jgi:hypothetical protein